MHPRAGLNGLGNLRREKKVKRNLLITLTLAAMTVLAPQSAKADTTTAGGVSYTFTTTGTDTVELVIDTSGATTTGTLSSFSVQFTGATGVSLASSPGNAWAVQGQGPNNPGGCNINGSANLWCSSGPAVSVPDGTLDFVFDVTMPGGVALPTDTHIQAFQGQGDLAISNDVGIGTPGTPSSTPEPGSLILLGTGLLGLAGATRRRSWVS
jgi:PEP-CTERM motif